MSKEDSDIPAFSLYGEGMPFVHEAIQSTLDLRSWNDLSNEEKATALQEVLNNGWITKEDAVLGTVVYLNHMYLRLCPGKNLHMTPKVYDRFSGNLVERKEAAVKDFCRIFIEEAEPLVLQMLSKFLELLIDQGCLNRAKEAVQKDVRAQQIETAFDSFDRFANCINHIFEQFAVNQLVTRNGLVPRQDETITRELHSPTLEALSDPKWQPVNETLALMFEDYRERKFPEAITKAHSAVHGFLQILVGEPGSNAKGELGKLMKEGKSSGLIPMNRFTEPFLLNIQGFITSERATNSTAKPSLSEASSADALLMMNMTLLFLQHCLQAAR